MSDIPEWAMEKARGVARLSVERPYNKGTVQRAAEVIARAILQADQEATERAAKWHESQADTLQQYENHVVKSGVWPDTNGRLKQIAFHREAASAIREARQG